ncbi:MAG: polysaccharide biosynthesis tyrosine autokinase [candidate division KSB1 bacterium]|nr:polysaccharide biosynthesis tyrosine autokinase [candidate division KSB1 bacterium]
MAYEEYDITDQQIDPSEAPQVNFSKYMRGIWKRKWIILVLCVLVAIPFYYHAANQVPKYKCTVTIQSKKLGDSEGRLLDDVRQAEIRSRMFSERIASALGEAFVLTDSTHERLEDIFQDYRTTQDPVDGNYQIKVTGLGDYYLLQNGTIIDSASVWEAVENNRNVNGLSFRLNPEFVKFKNKASFRIQPFKQAVQQVGNAVTPRFSRSGNFMVLEMIGTDPKVLPKKLNRIAQVYVDETMVLESRDIDSYRKMLQKKLSAAEKNVKESEGALSNFYSRYPLALDSERQKLLDEISQVNAKLRELPQQRKLLTSYLDKLDSLQTDEDELRRLIVHELSRFPALEEEPELRIFRQKLISLEKEYDELYRQYSPENPQLLAIKQRIEDTQNQIIQYASHYRNELVAREVDFKKRAKELDAQLKQLPANEYRLMKLERNQKIDDQLYSYLYTEIQKMLVSESVTGETIRIMEPAQEPTSTINPSKKMSAMMGGGLGLLLGILLSIVIDLFDRKIHTSSDVENTLHLKVLADIPHVKFSDIPEYSDYEKAKYIDKQLVTHDYSPTSVGEAYRSLRTHLMFSKEIGQINTLLITSTQPGEGKSFTASNLAIILAQQRSSTLLVDGDLRRGVQHNTFDCKKEPGLTNYLNNSYALSGLVQKTHIPNLSLVSCGSMIPNPSELLGSRYMERFLLEAKRKFEFIIFDTPPLDAATDSVVLGTQMDAVALVVRVGMTNSAHIKKRLEVFNTVPANLIGAILNGNQEEQVKEYYSYYHY